MDVAGPSSATTTQSSVTINDLPVEILQKLFSYFDCKDLFTISLVSNKWRGALNSKKLWEEVNWVVASRTEVGEVEAILQNIPAVCNIRFLYQYNDANLYLEKILFFCNNLRKLDIGELKCVDAAALDAIFQKFRNIEELRVRLEINDGERIVEMIGSYDNLKRLALVSSDAEFHLKPIAHGCSQFTHLDIKDMKFDVDEVAYLLQRKKHSILSLQFTTPSMMPDKILPLRECTNLEHVRCINSLHTHDVFKKILEEIAFLPKLKRLELCQWYAAHTTVLTEFFQGMSSMNLEELDLFGYPFMSSELADAIKVRCPLLKKLRVSNYSKSQIFWLETLLQLPHLRHVDMQGFTFAEGWFQQLLQCNDLNYLNMSNCRNLKDEEIWKLLTSLKLDYLNIEGCESLRGGFFSRLRYDISRQALKIWGNELKPTTLVVDEMVRSMLISSSHLITSPEFTRRLEFRQNRKRRKVMMIDTNLL